MRTGGPAIEVDKAFVAEPGALPDAERRIQFDRCRGEAVLKRRYVDDRFEGRARWAKCLDGSIVARADHVKAALHRKHPAGVNLLDKHSAGHLRHRLELPGAGSRLLPNNDLAGLQRAEPPPSLAPYCRDSATPQKRARRAVLESDRYLSAILR